jgi:hypothetical protein
MACSAVAAHRMLQALLVVIAALPVAEPTPRVWNGTYTIVNKASGRRICSSELGFSATSGGVVNPTHRWRLVPQGDDTVAIVNADNDMRIFAQNGQDHEGFLTINNGPIYQDQRWRMVLQNDASYMLENLRSGRRMLARTHEDGASGFFAVSGDGPVVDEQRWWLVNPDKDEAGPLFQDIEAERASNRRLASSVLSLQAEVSDRSGLAQELAAKSGLASRLDVQLQEALDSKVWLEHELNSTLVHNAEAGQELLALRETLPLSSLVAASIVGGIMSVCYILTVCTCWCRLHHAHQAAAFSRSAQAGTGECQLVSKTVGKLDELDVDFAYCVLREDLDGEPARIIKIVCPGVEHEDVEVELVWNGCEVTIRRRASLGLPKATWSKHFQFDPSEGLFEFKEDQMQLDNGILQLVLRGYSFRGRAVRFPQHYSLASSDSDLCWEFSEEGDASIASGPCAEIVSAPKVEPLEQAVMKDLSNSSKGSLSTASSPRRRHGLSPKTIGLDWSPGSGETRRFGA